MTNIQTLLLRLKEQNAKGAIIRRNSWLSFYTLSVSLTDTGIRENIKVKLNDGPNGPIVSDWCISLDDLDADNWVLVSMHADACTLSKVGDIEMESQLPEMTRTLDKYYFKNSGKSIQVTDINRRLSLVYGADGKNNVTVEELLTPLSEMVSKKTGELAIKASWSWLKSHVSKVLA